MFSLFGPGGGGIVYRSGLRQRLGASGSICQHLFFFLFTCPPMHRAIPELSLEIIVPRCNADLGDFHRLHWPPPATLQTSPQGARKEPIPPRHGRVEGHTHFGRRPPAVQSNPGDFSSCNLGQHLGPSLVTLLLGPIPGAFRRPECADTGWLPPAGRP